ncbi:MAG: glycosyltransferase [Candidatus Moraniibacteriota bacterium]|nr:MAG: glycosyltransferase [Candidatus Moranbacteria bacterium]
MMLSMSWRHLRAIITTSKKYAIGFLDLAYVPSMPTSILKLELPALEPMALRKKIIHLVPTLERGGSEMSQLRMLPYLNDEIESIFITLKQEGSLAPKFREKDITVIAINQKGLWDFVSYVRLLKILRSLHPNLIVTHLLYADIVGRFLVQFFVTPPVIASLATTYNFPSYWPARLFERLTKYFTKGYIANAEIVKKTYVEKFGVPEKKITVLTTGMDTEALSSLVPDASLRQSLGIDAHDTVLISVANLHINKGHRYLLEAFEELYPTYPETKLLLVGDGLERENLENQVKNYQSKNAILFLGKRSDVPQLLALSHIFVLPTFFEGMCNAIMEAMTRGLAVVTTDIQENQELITHKKTGLLCPIRNTKSLSELLELLLQNTTLRNTIGEAAKQSIDRRYNLPESVNRWRNFFLTIPS